MCPEAMKTNEIKIGMKLKYLVTRTTETVKEVRPARKDHFGDVLTPAVVVFDTQFGKCWDVAENFEALKA